MEIKLESLNGEIYEAYQKDKNTFVVLINGEEYKISIFQTGDQNINYKVFTNDQKKRMTKAIFENKEVLEQLDASERDSEEDDIEDIEELLKIVREVNDEYK
jgi:hypothetical protein